MDNDTCDYGIAAFKSRQEAVMFDRMLKNEGLRSRMVSAPKEVSLGCGVAVRIEAGDFERAAEISRSARLRTLTGFYCASDGHGRRILRAYTAK